MQRIGVETVLQNITPPRVSDILASSVEDDDIC